MGNLYFQGDMLIEAVPSAKISKATVIAPDSDGSTVIGRGEVTGHRHRFALEDRVVMFRDEAMARDVDLTLYVGHIKVGSKGARLIHEEHDGVSIPPGMYRIRRQREWTFEDARVVAD
jgi:hypothetical protein